MGPAAATAAQPGLRKAESSPLPAILQHPAVLATVLVIATVALYYPVHTHPFVNFDDNDYIYENTHVQAGLTGQTFQWALTKATAANWHPITWLVHALDCQLFGLNPAGHHDVNLLFHAIDVALLFWVLLQATGFAGRSFMVAALFALHPINVESVAWVAELKTMLSTMFFLLALGAYTWGVKNRSKYYVSVAILFALGLMSKPQIITLPFVLLLWDYWPLQRMSPGKFVSESPLSKSGLPRKSLFTLALEKWPLFLLALASAIITIKAQHGARAWFPRLSRAGNSVLAYALYVRDAIWPSRLAILYPHPGASLNWWKVLAAALVLLAITAGVILGRRHRYLLIGWLWFLGTLVPMTGIVQVGVQARADRYAYVSFIGLFIMACWSLAELARYLRIPSAVMAVASVAVLLSFSIAARRQLSYWQTEEGLWTHTLQVTKGNVVAESELGTALANAGNFPEAMVHFSNALALNPTDSNTNMGIAVYDLRQGNFAEAIIHFRVVINDSQARLRMRQEAYLGMAKSYWTLGDKAKSDEYLAKARQLR